MSGFLQRQFALLGGLTDRGYACQVVQEFIAKVLPSKSEGNCRLEESRLRTTIEPIALEAKPMYGTTFVQFLRDCVGQLNLAARTTSDVA